MIDPAHERILCALDDIPDGGARGFLPERRDDRVFAVRRGPNVFVYLNCCPHDRIALEFAKDKFLSGDGREIVCYAHAAHFDIESGECVEGICLGESLVAVPHRIEDGAVIVPLTLPPPPPPMKGR